MKIAVDAMGGDHAPAAIVEGAVRAAREGIEVLLVGRREDLRPLLDRADAAAASRIELVDAPDVIEMHDQPAQAVRRKKDASLVVCADLVKEGRADGMFSAGNTGAGMAVCLFKWGRIRGIDRPAIATPLPNPRGYGVLLDAGANVDVPAACYLQYAVMGAIYAREVLGVPDPRVGLLNIGEEEGKGNDVVRQAFSMLKQADVRFIGNVEGRDIFLGRVDVAVCDGFVGNVALKSAEGAAELILTLFRDEIRHNVLLKMGAMAIRPALERVRRRTDYGEKGGAPLLGVNGVCIIGHGRSRPRAVANAIRTTGEAVSHAIVDKIREQIAA